MEDCEIDLIHPNGFPVHNEADLHPSILIGAASAVFGAGFLRENCEITQELSMFDFETKEGVKKFAAGINMFRAVIPKDLLEEYDTLCAEHLISGPYFKNSGKPFACHMLLMRVIAEKK